MSDREQAAKAAIGKMIDTGNIELTMDERLKRCNDEVASVLRKYNMTLVMQSVPVIVPAQEEAKTDLKA